MKIKLMIIAGIILTAHRGTKPPKISYLTYNTEYRQSQGS
jgi:hypothetical protein